VSARKLTTPLLAMLVTLVGAGCEKQEEVQLYDSGPVIRRDVIVAVEALICYAVAVIVFVVTRFNRTRIHRSIAVITIYQTGASCLCIETIVIAICAFYAAGSLIYLAIAVIIDSIADLPGILDPS